MHVSMDVHMHVPGLLGWLLECVHEDERDCGSLSDVRGKWFQIRVSSCALGLVSSRFGRHDGRRWPSATGSRRSSLPAGRAATRRGGEKSYLLSP